MPSHLDGYKKHPLLTVQSDVFWIGFLVIPTLLKIFVWEIVGGVEAGVVAARVDSSIEGKLKLYEKKLGVLYECWSNPP